MTHSDSEIGKPLIAANLKSKGQHFRTIFEALGLEQQQTLGSIKYSGTINGRFLTIIVAPKTRNRYITGDISYRKYMGLMMSIELQTNIKTRLLLSKTASNQNWLVNGLQKRQGNQRVENFAQLYDGYQVWANEPDWAQRLFGETAVKNALHPLLYENSQPLGSTLQMTAKGGIIYMPSDVSANISVETIQTIISGLVMLAAVAEQFPPLEQVQLRWMEKQTSGTQVFVIIAAFLIGLPIVTFVLCIFPFLMMMLILNSF